jgi:hypothetical protein
MNKPKKPSIDLIKEKKFSKMMEGMTHLPSKGIISKMDSRMFSLSGNRLYYYKPEILASEEYRRCLELFKRRLPGEYNSSTREAAHTLYLQLQMIDNVVFNKEMRHIEELKIIAVDTVRNLFDIPDHVTILPEISKDLSVNPEEQDDSPEPLLSLSLEDKRRLEDEIRKREILAGLVQGCAMHIWKSAYYIVKEQIDKLDPMLMTLYDQYTTSVGWLIWQLSPDDMQSAIGSGNVMMQGFCKLDFQEKDEPECNIHCHATNFPVLLHEVTKGALDYLITRGVPQDLSNEELKYYYAKSDDYENEFWHYLLSPTIWNKLVEAADVETQALPLVIARLTELTYQELSEVLKACIDDATIGNKKLREKHIL